MITIRFNLYYTVQKNFKWFIIRAIAVFAHSYSNFYSYNCWKDFKFAGIIDTNQMGFKCPKLRNAIYELDKNWLIKLCYVESWSRSIVTIKKITSFLKRTIMSKPTKSYTGNVNACIFWFSYIVYHNKLAYKIRTESSFHTREMIERSKYSSIL